MTIAAVHQIIPSLTTGDAVGAHTMRVRTVLRQAGFESEIFSNDVAPALVSEARPISDLPAPAPERIALIYQCSIGSDLVEVLLRRPDPLVVNYHNLTPMSQLLRWSPEMAHLVTLGRMQLGRLASRALLGIGDSSLNTAELRLAGFSRATTVPVLLELAAATRHEGSPDPEGSRARWLFVGRVVPNKAQHDLIVALAWYRAVHDPAAELRLVGKVAAPRYAAELEDLVSELGLDGAVTLTGTLDDARLEREYQTASVFVCLSDHEGFGIPLLEAMAFGVPVVAYASSAIPETVGTAGLLLPSKEPSMVAAAAHRVSSDQGLRSYLRDAGRRRAADFDIARTGSMLLDALGTVLWP